MNPFFAYSVKVPQEKLQEIGYAPIGNIYVGINLDEEPPYPANLQERIRDMKGTNTVFWLTVRGRKVKDDAKVAALIRDLASVAEEAGVKVALYPHFGFYVATARDALRFVKEVDRKNVGLTINLCHELKAGNGDELPKIVDEMKDHLFVVTVNGADRVKDAKSAGWDRLIRPLGNGDFDVYAFLKKVKSVGFNGPIGLQCYGLKEEPVAHLTQSMKTWKEYSARLAAEKDDAKNP
ncbi:MAG: sugar phosphate isomerase/epimerase family protein [Planctomycetota bacterium]